MYFFVINILKLDFQQSITLNNMYSCCFRTLWILSFGRSLLYLWNVCWTTSSEHCFLLCRVYYYFFFFTNLLSDQTLHQRINYHVYSVTIYFPLRYHTNDIELLFHILRCFTSRFIVQFQFVKDFLDNVVAGVSGGRFFSGVFHFRSQCYCHQFDRKLNLLT